MNGFNPNRSIYDIYAGKKKVNTEKNDFSNDADDLGMFMYHVLKRLEALEGK